MGSNFFATHYFYKIIPKKAHVFQLLEYQSIFSLLIIPLSINSFINGSANSTACGCGFPVVPIALNLKKFIQSLINAVFIYGELIAQGNTVLAC